MPKRVTKDFGCVVVCLIENIIFCFLYKKEFKIHQINPERFPRIGDPEDLLNVLHFGNPFISAHLVVIEPVFVKMSKLPVKYGLCLIFGVVKYCIAGKYIVRKSKWRCFIAQRE